MKNLRQNRIKLLLMPVLLCAGIIAFGQTPEEAVMEPVNLLFEGMKKADSAMVKKAFFKEAKMFTSTKNKNGEDVITQAELAKFLNLLGSKNPNDPAWNEKIFNTQIKVDGGMAQVWTEYSFFIGEKFSHCGVNAFQLLKDQSGWKIIHIMDTRRKQNCNEVFTK